MRILFAAAVMVACASFGVAQYHQTALARAKEIRLLLDDRAAVRQAMREFNLESSNDTSDHFEFGETRVGVTYSSGECDEGEEEVWDVPAGKVIQIEIRENSEAGWVDASFNLSKLKKEQMYRGYEAQSIFHSKREGFAVEVVEDEIDRVVLFPPIGSGVIACKNKYAKEFIAMKSWFGSKKLEDRWICILVNQHANVTGLSLSHDRISGLSAKRIEVTTTAVDPENDVLTYNYLVTGGRIIGTGLKVFWDLTGVAPGTYSITAAVDDGAGLVGAKATKTVTVE